MGAGGSVPDNKDDALAKAKEVYDANPGNRCAKHLQDDEVKEMIKGLEGDDLKDFAKCIRTGIDNPDSGLGCYAVKPDDYDKYGVFFNKVIGDYHKNDTEYARLMEAFGSATARFPGFRGLLSQAADCGDGLGRDTTPHSAQWRVEVRAVSPAAFAALSGAPLCT